MVRLRFKDEVELRFFVRQVHGPSCGTLVSFTEEERIAIRSICADENFHNFKHSSPIVGPELQVATNKISEAHIFDLSRESSHLDILRCQFGGSGYFGYLADDSKMC
jgi:hypothetical protein